MRNVSLFALVFFASPGVSAADTVDACESSAQTVFLVRHAEKAPDSGDGNPSLSAKGLARAEALRVRMEIVGLDALFASPFQRTQETLAPLAEARDMPVNIIGALDIDGLVEELFALPSPSRALVAGHSNTVPLILQALGVADPPSIGESEFGDLFVVTRSGDQVIFATFRFGD